MYQVYSPAYKVKHHAAKYEGLTFVSLKGGFNIFFYFVICPLQVNDIFR